MESQLLICCGLFTKIRKLWTDLTSLMNEVCAISRNDCHQRVRTSWAARKLSSMPSIMKDVTNKGKGRVDIRLHRDRMSAATKQCCRNQAGYADAFLHELRL